MEKTVKIILVKSGIARKPNQKKTLHALGLRKIGDVVVKVDNEAIRGMINTVKHLVEVIK